ncbi:hypothetical protein [Nocardioides sp. LHG3406-4]|uniref:hypothetical protein n=1 Tax=Nocardioides sp. LHG3406-4 TaxID=2804575 RepID=UPI003CFBC0C1
MPGPNPAADPLVVHLMETTGLSSAEARRVIDDVVAFHRESTDDFVRRRHARLKAHGAKNSDIYDQIATELAQRVVAGPELTARQVRRIIYG